MVVLLPVAVAAVVLATNVASLDTLPVTAHREVAAAVVAAAATVVTTSNFPNQLLLWLFVGLHVLAGVRWLLVNFRWRRT